MSAAVVPKVNGLLLAAIAFGGWALLRKKKTAPAPDDGAPSAPAAEPTRQPGEESARRQAEIEAGEALGLARQAAGELTEPLDVARVEGVTRDRVVVADPRGGIRDDPRIHKLSATDATYKAVHDYFWQSLSWSGAGFHYIDPVTSTDHMVAIEQPAGVFHQPQLMPTAQALRQQWVQAYWADGRYTTGARGRSLTPNARSRQHSIMDPLVRASAHAPMDRTTKLAGLGALRGVFEHFPVFMNYEYLIRAEQVYGRSIVVPSGQEGIWSLICASEQGKYGSSPTLSQWVTPLAYLMPDFGGGDTAGERTVLEWHAAGEAEIARRGSKRLARLHPITGQPWRCFSFMRTREVPENPTWSFVWWSPWYPQSRDDDSRTCGVLPRTYEPHLGGGSQYSDAFKEWAVDLHSTGDPPRGQWIGAIPVGLPQDCRRVDELVRCGETDDWTSTIGEDELWRMEHNPRGSVEATAAAKAIKAGTLRPSGGAHEAAVRALGGTRGF